MPNHVKLYLSDYKPGFQPQTVPSHHIVPRTDHRFPVSSPLLQVWELAEALGTWQVDQHGATLTCQHESPGFCGGIIWWFQA